MPHAPQWALSVCVSRQAPEQLVSPEPHDTRHAPSSQLSPVAQRTPHAPQWVRSLARSRQAPEQSVNPTPQVVLQRPRRHTCPKVHAVPQAPQLRGSAVTSVHTSGSTGAPPLSPASATPASPAARTGHAWSSSAQLRRQRPAAHA